MDFIGQYSGKQVKKKKRDTLSRSVVKEGTENGLGRQ